MEGQRAPLLVVIPPPAIYGLTFAAAMILDRVMPWRPGWEQAGVPQWLGWAFIVAGIILGPGSAAFFALRRTTLTPSGMPARLVTDGPLTLTRNPMYVGITLIYLGAALVIGKAWPLLLVILPWAVTNWIVIPFEEERLRGLFGESYVQYCRRVRRWL